VFSYKGKPIRQVSTKAWYAALERAGITDFRWHDLRHTWASWHVQNGTPLHALQGLGGWDSPEMVRRDAHFRPSIWRPIRIVCAEIRHGGRPWTNLSRATNFQVAG
jgi:integrase